MDPLDQLRLYQARVHELTDTRLVRGGFNPGLTINFDRMNGLQFASREPDSDDLRSFLLTFRMFMSDQEPVFLYRIYNLCHQHLRSEELKGYLVESRKAWTYAQKDGRGSLVFNDRTLTPEYITDLWINGIYFHSHERKRAILLSLMPHERMLLRHHFLSFLVDGTRQVFYTANIINAAFKEGLFDP